MQKRKSSEFQLLTAVKRLVRGFLPPRSTPAVGFASSRSPGQCGPLTPVLDSQLLPHTLPNSEFRRSLGSSLDEIRERKCCRR